MDETRHLIERAHRTAEEARRVEAETRRLVQTSREIQQWTARVQGRGAGTAVTSFSFNRFSNRLLGLLPAPQFSHLAPLLQGFALTPKQVLHLAQSTIQHVYFPVSGLLSATMIMGNGQAMSISTIGNDGMAGLAALIGNSVSPHDLVVQIPGNALRLDVETFQAELRRDGVLRDSFLGYHSACAVQSAYDIACNGLHTVRQRCCRQLLCIQDRIASDILPLTHESLSLMLGVRRASVTEELNLLQERGIIDTQRGKIHIVDRSTLESLACECYESVAHEFGRLFQSNGYHNTAGPPGQKKHREVESQEPM